MIRISAGHWTGHKHHHAALCHLADPILGRRLRDNVRLMIGHKGKTALDILGSADGLKLWSSKTDAQFSIHDPRISKRDSVRITKLGLGSEPA